MALVATLAAIFALIGPNPAARAATTERIVTNRYSGLAIEGFDPVAYFTDAQAIRGVPDFEAAEAGVVWRFHNASNRDAFAAHPEVYGPQFGGYDPIDVARGIAYAGNPLFFVVTGHRLYLFAREESRDSFAANPARYLKDAVERWPAVQKTLAQ
jgi:hypothetical protein